MLGRILGAGIGLSLLAPAVAFAMLGDRDPAWGERGEARYELGFARTLQSVGAFTVLPDGGVVSAGYSAQNSRPVATVVSTDSRGAPRAGFGTDGGLLVTAGVDGLVTGMASTGSGALVVSVATMPLSAGVRVERLTSSGARDTAFGSGGRAEVPDREPFRSCFSGAVTVDEQGRTLVACVPLGVLRITAAGEIDTSYGNDGFAALPPQVDGGVFKLDRAGRLIVGGEGEAPWLARLRPDGTRDPTFADDGMRTSLFSSTSSPPWGLVEDDDGRLVVSGSAGVTRLLADGTRDPTFGAGQVTRPVSGAVGKGDLALDDAGRVLWATDAPDRADASSITPQVFRIDEEGSVDPDFVTEAVGDPTATGSPIRLAVHGSRVLVSVGSLSSYQAPRVRVVALHGNGDRDDSWADGGVATLAQTGPDSTWLRALELTTNGSAFLAGLTSRDGVFPATVVRAGPDGTLDPSFHGAGAGLPPVPGFEAIDMFGLAPAVGGGIVALGVGVRADGRASAFLAAMRAGGGFDPNYGDGGLALLGDDDGWWSSARVVADGDGHVVARTFYEDGRGRVAVSRRLGDGRADPGWRLGAPLLLRPAERDASVHDVIRTRSGAIVIAGALSGPNAGEPGEGFVLKLQPGGEPDPAFGDGGVALVRQAWPTRVAIAEDPAGRLIVAVGASANASSMIRLNGDTGAQDATFGDNGVVIVNAHPAVNEGAEDLAVDNDGRILVLSNLMSYPTAAAISAFDGNGAPDHAYGSGGTTVFSDRIGQMVRVDPHGRAVVLVVRPVGALLHSSSVRLQGNAPPPEVGSPGPGSEEAPQLSSEVVPGTVRPIAPPQPHRPPPTTPASSTALMAPSLALRGSTRASIVRARGLRVVAFCPAGCRGQIDVLLSSKDARRLGTARRVARRRLHVTPGLFARATLRLPAKVIRARRAPVLTVRLEGRDRAARRLRPIVVRTRLRR